MTVCEIQKPVNHKMENEYSETKVFVWRLTVEENEV